MTTSGSPETNPSATASAQDLKTKDQKKPPLNLILQGPPGTGKTYATIDRALQIFDFALLTELNNKKNPTKTGKAEDVIRNAEAEVRNAEAAVRNAEAEVRKAEEEVRKAEEEVRKAKSAQGEEKVRNAEDKGHKAWSAEKTAEAWSGLATAWVIKADAEAMASRLADAASRLAAETAWDRQANAESSLKQAMALKAEADVRKEEEEIRKAKKARFDALVAEGRVKLVTFHQSFGYEDFVEGLRATNAETDKGITYEVAPGVFKQLCSSAKLAAANLIVTKFVDAAEKEPQHVAEQSGAEYEVTYDPQKERASLSVKMVRKGYKALEASNEDASEDTKNKIHNANIERIKRVLSGDAIPRSNETYVKAIANYLKPQLIGMQPDRTLPHVLIIDEINRGNVSRIFGELITLIEPSKRKGQPEAVETTLPYSGDEFSVPDNVYIIGTMNTADRSLTGLDIALRRRFTFEEMLPRPELLEGVEVKGVSTNGGDVSVPLDKLLSAINKRIEVLLDRDHLIGHAYFMPLTEPGANTVDRLAEVFRGQVLPLLQEYFFDDWARIGWVLNDPDKNKEHKFVDNEKEEEAKLFGDATGKQIKGLTRTQRWRLNETAFDKIDSYHGVLSKVR